MRLLDRVLLFGGLMKITDKRVHGFGIKDTPEPVTFGHMVDGKWVIKSRCHMYATWSGMIMRCYYDKSLKVNPSYGGCSVWEGWKYFSAFRSWMETQDYEGKHLDKDLLVFGNKIYSPDTCIFIPIRINSFLVDSKGRRGDCLLGTWWDTERGKYQTQCRNPFTGKKEYLGRYNTQMDAHLAWKTRKHELACQLADSEYCTDDRVANALRVRYLRDMTNV